MEVYNWQNQRSMVDVPLPCLITRQYSCKMCSNPTYLLTLNSRYLAPDAKPRCLARALQASERKKQHVLLSATRRYPLWMMFRHCLYPQFGLVLAVETLRCFSIRHPFRNQRLTNHHCQFPQSSINWSSMKHHIPKSSAKEGAGLSSLSKPLNSWQPTPRRAKALWLFPELDPLFELLNSLVQMQFIYCMCIYIHI